MKDHLYQWVSLGLIGLVLILVALGGRILPTAARPEHTLSVAGEATLDVTPDQAAISLGLTLRASTAQEAQKQGAAKMDAVVKALKDGGVKAEDIQTRAVSMNPVYDYTQNGTKFLGYELNNIVTFKTGDFAAMGGLIDKAVAAGANRVDSLQFQLKDRSAHHQEAIGKAIADARSKADAAAKGLGTKVIGVKTVNIQDDQSSPVPMRSMDMKVASGAATSTPIEPGQVQFRVTVSIEFIVR